MNNKETIKQEVANSGEGVLTVDLPSERQLKQALINAGIEDPATITKLIITGKFEKSQEGMLDVFMKSTLIKIGQGFIPNQNDELFLYLLANKKNENIILPCLQSIVILPKSIVFTKKDGVWYYDGNYTICTTIAV